LASASSVDRTSVSGERLGGISGKRDVSCLNVLRTVAEGLLDLQRQPAVVARNDSAIDAVAAARVQLDAEHADAVARPQGIASGISLAGQGVDLQVLRIG
jgi:hypothetical protein